MTIRSVFQPAFRHPKVPPNRIEKRELKYIAANGRVYLAV